MPYDPNDPNQGSQAPAEDQSTAEWQAKNAMTTGTINDLIRSRPAIAQWLAVHNNGKGLSDSDKSALFSLLHDQGIDPTHLEVNDETGVISWPKHVVRDIAYGSLMAFGPVVAAWALPYAVGAATPAASTTGGVAGVEGGAYGVSSGTLASLGTGAMGAVPVTAGVSAPVVAGTAGAAAAPSAAVTGTGASAVDAAVDTGSWDAAGNFIGPSTVSSVAGGGGGSSLGATIGRIANSSWFPTLLGVAGNLGGAAIQANASSEAAAAQERSAKEALDFVKSQAALEQKNFAPYLAAGTGALSKLSYGLGIGNEADYTSNGAPATPPGGSPGSITPAGDPVVSPNSPAAQFINNTRTQPVWMTAPTGERKQVPANQVQHYLELGAKLEPGQGLSGGSVPRPNSLALLGRTPPAGSQTIGTAVTR